MNFEPSWRNSPETSRESWRGLGAEAVAEALRRGLEPKPRLTPAAFGERYRVIVKSGQKGPYRISKTPWAAKIFWALSDDSPYREILAPKGTQLGFTDIGLIWIGEGAVRGYSGLIIEPTESTAKKIAKTKWREFISTTAPLKALFTGRAADATLHYSAPSVDVILAGSNSPANFASITMQRAMADDFDRWSKELLREGDPLTLLRNRLVAAGVMGKLFVPSSPTLDDSGIWPLWLQTDQQVFKCPCPKCGVKQQWLWENMHWTPGAPATVVLRCIACGEGSGEYAWKTAWQDGEWEATSVSSRPEVIGFHLSSLYAMLGNRSWESTASEYEGYKALGQASNFQTFNNTVLGLPHKESEAAVPVDELRARLENDLERGVVAPGGLCITCYIDYQGNRLEAWIWAWARQLERWLVDRIVIPRMKPGPEGKDVRRPAHELAADLRRLVLDVQWPHALGGSLPVEMALHDVADGPADVYDVIDLLPKDTNIGSLGLEGWNKTELFNPAKPQDVRRDGKIVKMGRMRMSIHTAEAKKQFYLDLRRPLAEEGPSERYVHIPGWVDEEEGLLAQFVAEEIRISTRGKRHWHKLGRNEGLDCAIGADAARWLLRTHNWPELVWLQREAFVAAPPPPPPPTEDRIEPTHDAAPARSWVGARPDWLNR